MAKREPDEYEKVLLERIEAWKDNLLHSPGSIYTQGTLQGLDMALGLYRRYREDIVPNDREIR
jgi:hypothetical protein